MNTDPSEPIHDIAIIDNYILTFSGLRTIKIYEIVQKIFIYYLRVMRF